MIARRRKGTGNGQTFFGFQNLASVFVGPLSPKVKPKPAHEVEAE
jgi:hypothetical protein